MPEPLYIQLTWEDPQTGEIQQPILAAPIAIGREKEQMPEYLGEQSVSRLELVDKQISRFHTLITVGNNQMYITDKSANGTFLNGQQISKGSQNFCSKDTVRIGPYKITATLMGDGDLNATELTRERPVVAPMSSALPKNPLLIWFLGGVVLLLMGLGGWLLVSMLLNQSRPQPENSNPSSVNSNQ
jgi:FHA domain